MSGSRIPIKDEAQSPCEFAYTLRGENCGGSGETLMHGLFLCGRHARQLRLEEREACWEAMLLHVGLWRRFALDRGRGDMVRLLEVESSRAEEAQERTREELNDIEGVYWW